MEVASSSSSSAPKRGLIMNSSKLIMSFYRGAKPPPSAVQAVKPSPASNLAKTTSFRNDDREGSFGKSGGDEHVDNRAASYISHVKERRKLEELNLLEENNCESL
ncbi:hypothetical protein PHJA_000983700 [Phtheirospermum japonicum]|uniref:Uncharacterized protein n=1 Tax=Phtheirospermum japonicum TaxID=374723 RepID=A0A830BLB5_9LAMI|nr:hypothetical protein PHJA_000983700 [Phtheirospermum japonicum]